MNADNPSRDEALWSLYRDELDVLLVRNVYDPGVMSRIYADLESNRLSSLLLQRDHVRESPQVQVLGLAIAPSDLAPGGPAIGDYLDAAERFRPICAELFAPQPSFPPRMEQVFSRLSGGRAIRNASTAGRGYGPATIRRVPPGADEGSLASGIYRPHCENLYLRIPAFDPIRGALDLTRIISYFVTIGNAERGGELVVYPDVRFKEGHREVFPPTGALLEGTPDEPAHGKFAPDPGDAIVFAAGPVYHRVTPVYGARARWTIGGFGAFAHDGSGFHYWA